MSELTLQECEIMNAVRACSGIPRTRTVVNKVDRFNVSTVRRVLTDLEERGHVYNAEPTHGTTHVWELTARGRAAID